MTKEDCIDALITQWEEGEGDLFGAIEFLEENDYTNHGIASDEECIEGTDVSAASLILRGLLTSRPDSVARFLELLALRGHIVLMAEKDAWVPAVQAACEGSKKEREALAALPPHPSATVAAAIALLCQ